MLVKDILRAKPIVCLVDDNLRKPARLLAENDLVCIPVVESIAHKNLLGVITDREICRQAVAAGLDLSKTKAGRVMSCRFLKVDPETEADECVRLMKENNMDYVLVTDENNTCMGIVTREDLPVTNFRFPNQNYSYQNIRNDRIF